MFTYPVCHLGEAGYAADAVTFDGTNDYLNRTSDFSGNADGKLGIFSCWFKMGSGSDTADIKMISNDTGKFRVLRQTDDTWKIDGSNVSTGQKLKLVSNSTWTVSDGWYHLLAAWDLVNTTGYMYISDADDLAASPVLVDGTIDYTKSIHSIGSNHIYSNKMDGDVADCYLNLAEYIDISVEANRRKFISAAGKPVFLGADGSLPTGSQPILFHSGPAASFATNLGSGGTMTENGALTDASTSPSD